jgi:hypothetical protein
MKTFFEKYRALILGSVSGVVLLGTFFKLFKWFPIDLAKSLDKEWGFYLTLIQFVGIVIGIAINRKDLKSSFTSISQPKKHLLILGSIVLFFGIFTATQVEKQHRVLSDETSWESLGLMMIHHQSGGVCNEGYYDDDRNLVCERNVNNFKGKATPFAYYLGSFFGEFDRDFALQFNLLFYLASLIFIYLIVLLIENNWKLAALTSICLGAFPKYIFQAQTATTEVLYIASGLLVLLALVALKKQTLSMKHLVLIVPLMAFFSGTRLETVFAFGAFTVMMLPLFNKKIQNLPTYIASSFLFCLPAVITIAAYKGYDFQGGDHDAHSLGNLKSNFLENLEIMLQWGKGNNGLLEAPFSTTQSIWLYIATIFLLALCFKSKKLVYWLIPSLLFFIQPLVVMINVSGTFKIDINQRYVLIALPLFAFIMARAIHHTPYHLNSIVHRKF